MYNDIPRIINFKTVKNICTNASHLLKQEGPKGPWVAHLRKRSKVTVEPFIEDQ